MPESESLRTLKFDIDNGIFEINGKQIRFCTGFELSAYIGVHGPSFTLIINTETCYSRKLGREEFERLGGMKER